MVQGNPTTMLANIYTYLFRSRSKNESISIDDVDFYKTGVHTIRACCNKTT